MACWVPAAMSIDMSVLRSTFLFAAVALVSACGTRTILPVRTPAGNEPLQVLRNGMLPPNGALPFRFENVEQPVLAELAARERLRQHINPRDTQFEQIVQIRKWVAAQWNQGVPNPYPPWNALTILDWIRSKKTGGFCGQYSQVLLQSLAALGFTARYVELGNRENPYIHYVVEVWSNDYNKWVVMDAAYNLHFTRAGVPLGALEVHDAYLNGGLGHVTVEWGRLYSHNRPYQWRYRTAELYYYVRFHLKGNHLSKPDEPAFDRVNDMVEWLDPHTVPWESSTVTSDFPKEKLTKQNVSDRSIALAPLNQVVITPRLAGQTVEIGLRTNTLQFQRYEFRVGSGSSFGPWQQTEEPIVSLSSLSGTHVVEVRAVNVKGISGPSSSVLVRLP